MDKLIIECPHCHEKFSGEEAFQDILDQTLESHKNSINEDLKKQAEADAQDKINEIENKFNQEKEELKIQNQIEKKRLKKKLEEAQKPLSQESMEIQGEVGEKWLENFLSHRYPHDQLSEIKKGALGGDCVLTVNYQGEEVGSIYFESKRVSKFSNNWVKKLLENMQDEQRNYGVIVTSAMPAAFQSELEPWIERENKRIFIVKNKKPLLSALIDGLRDLIIYKHLKNAELSKRLDNQSENEQKASAFLQEGILQNYLLTELKDQNANQDRIDKMERGFIKTVSNERVALADRKKNYQRLWKKAITLEEIPDNLLDGDDE